MKFLKCPNFGLLATTMGIVVIAILSGLLLLGMWIYIPIPIPEKIGATIVVLLVAGGLIAGLIRRYKLIHSEVFFGSGKKIKLFIPLVYFFLTTKKQLLMNFKNKKFTLAKGVNFGIMRMRIMYRVLCIWHP